MPYVSVDEADDVLGIWSSKTADKTGIMNFSWIKFANFKVHSDDDSDTIDLVYIDHFKHQTRFKMTLLGTITYLRLA